MYKRIIIQGQDKIINSNPLKRDINFNYEYLDLNKIITFIGPRRAGKTFFMFYILKQLISKNIIDIKQLIFIDFSALLLQEFDIEKLLENYFELYPDLTPFFVFDEIQELDNFNKIVLYLFDKGYKIFLSGSNSKLLSKELSTQFRGRTIDVQVFPLDFNEFLFFKTENSLDYFTEKGIGKLKNLFLEYLNFGAYPEIVLVNSQEIKLDLIKNYFEILLYKDLLERYGIENEFVIKFLVKKLLDSTTKVFNINKVYNELKSLNIKVGKQTIYNYLQYLQEIFFIKEINDKYTKGSKKYYFYDVGYNNINFKENLGIRFENVIFNYLSKKYTNINYINAKNGEIDFYIEEKQFYIQVCFELNNENIQREISLFKDINLENKYLVYFNKNINIEPNIENLKIINIFEFLKIIYGIQSFLM